MPIPKIIHFIWAGGEKLLPKVNADRIKAWAAKHRDFAIYLWIDKATTAAEKLSEYDTHYQFNHIANLHLKDITEEAVVDEFSRYHIDKLQPNYGASSDILRYSILCKFGGAYFDSDIETSDEKQPLNYDGLFDTDETAILHLTHYTQHHHALGNDAFICTPQHPFMQALYATVKSNHDTYLTSALNPYESSAAWRVSCYTTVEMTGPKALIDVCQKLDMLPLVATTGSDPHTLSVTINNVEYYQKIKEPNFILNQQCYQSSAFNEASWLSAPIRTCGLEEAMRIAVCCIQFEVAHFGKLCLDDHVTFIANSAGLIKDKQNIAKQLVELLKASAVNLEHCKVLQLVSRYSCISKFYADFAPHILDGYPASSDSALSKLTGELEDAHAQRVIQHYFFHVTEYLKLSPDNNAILLIRTHLHSLLMRYLDDEGDLSLIHAQIPLLKDNVLRDQEVEYLNNCIAMLTRSVKYILTSDNNESAFKSSLREYFCLHPKQIPMLTYLIFCLKEGQVVFEGARISLSKESAAFATTFNHWLSMQQRDFNAIVLEQKRKVHSSMFFSHAETSLITEGQVYKNRSSSQ